MSSGMIFMQVGVCNMTRKDYIKIAEVIRDNSTSTGKLARQSFIRDLCIMFEKDNPSFDGFRFMNACDPYNKEVDNG